MRFVQSQCISFSEVNSGINWEADRMSNRPVDDIIGVFIQEDMDENSS